MNFIGRTWGLELEGRDEEEYVVEFHSSSPPEKIENGRLIRQLGPTYRVKTKTPPNAEPTRTNLRRWNLNVAWPVPEADQ